jgi:hypothetical protein
MAEPQEKAMNGPFGERRLPWRLPLKTGLRTKILCKLRDSTEANAGITIRSFPGRFKTAPIIQRMLSTVIQRRQLAKVAIAY